MTQTNRRIKLFLWHAMCGAVGFVCAVILARMIEPVMAGWIGGVVTMAIAGFFSDAHNARDRG